MHRTQYPATAEEAATTIRRARLRAASAAARGRLCMDDAASAGAIAWTITPRLADSLRARKASFEQKWK